MERVPQCRSRPIDSIQVGIKRGSDSFDTLVTDITVQRQPLASHTPFDIDPPTYDLGAGLSCRLYPKDLLLSFPHQSQPQLGSKELGERMSLLAALAFDEREAEAVGRDYGSEAVASAVERSSEVHRWADSVSEDLANDDGETAARMGNQLVHLTRLDGRAAALGAAPELGIAQ